MRTNIEIARELGILKVQGRYGRCGREYGSVQERRLLILATGAQGDEFAASRASATSRTSTFSIEPTDTIVLSSSVIPGNERAVQKLKDNLSRQGAQHHHLSHSDVHASGHGNAEEAKWIHRRSIRNSSCRCTATTTCCASTPISAKRWG